MVWTLHDFYGSSNGRSTPNQRPEYIEMFEYLGLDVFAAPFHPHSDMTLPGRPKHSASRAAIKDGWTERLKGFGADSSNPCDQECKVENKDNVKEAVLTGLDDTIPLLLVLVQKPICHSILYDPNHQFKIYLAEMQVRVDESCEHGLVIL
ncbi:hypothetical protein K4K49_009658 [Colletotrichum sp. SAR 10_70]|nr:hypothetical protein K4K50_011777 [Colletotrichum sp. SAR 10_71]KAI8154512.1 hypothetical protein K4K49_009658 [Colletotrichum sp. SAR 10_70]KAJ4996573.1 hypothetical protein K4K48_008319 [Colletotrichum sp. SAR 10_66]